MKGKQLNTLCKTIMIFDKTVAMTDAIRIVDPTRVMMLEVESHDGTPVFGTTSEYGIPVNEIIKLKINAKQDLDVKTEGNMMSIDGYSIRLSDNPTIPNKIHMVHEHQAEVDGKRFKEAVKSCSLVSDSIVFESDDNGILYIKSYGESQKSVASGVQYQKDIGKAECRTRVIIPLGNYLTKLVKAMGDDIKVYIETDYPIKMEWSDEWYRYKAIIAPRIEDD